MLILGVYNEAGELVRTIASSPVSQSMTAPIYSIGTDTNPTTLVPGGTPLSIYMPGITTPDNVGAVGTTFSWDGINDAGQPVSSGNYYIKITQRDTYDHTIVLIKEISVLQAVEYVELTIYNSAGELVRTIRKYTTAPDKVVLKTDDIMIVKKTGSDITINYGPGITDYIKWDGKNDQGVVVKSGAYEIKVTSKTMAGAVAVAAKTVMVLVEGSDYLGDIKAYPNPYHRAGSMVFAWTGVGIGVINVDIININGELVRSLQGRIESGTLTWNGKTLAGQKIGYGYYICVFKAVNIEGYVQHKTLKIAIMGK